MERTIAGRVPPQHNLLLLFDGNIFRSAALVISQFPKYPYCHSCAAVSMPSHLQTAQGLHLHRIPLSYDNKASEQSALELVFAFDPALKTDPGDIEIIKFTDGITNNVGLLPAGKPAPQDFC